MIKNGRGLLEEEVRVDYNTAKYNMKETRETRDMIERLWAERTNGNARLFNASKFRLAGHGPSQEGGVFELRVGVTDYKDHVGTNLSPDVQKYIGEGDTKVYRLTEAFYVVQVKIFQFDLMSQCVGVGCWVTTTDGMVVFVENAAWKGEQACKVDRPGGHAEPSECVGEQGDAETMARIPPTEVRRELFDCIRREVRDEVNIATELQSQPELLGILYNHERGGRLCRFWELEKNNTDLDNFSPGFPDPMQR